MKPTNSRKVMQQICCWPAFMWGHLFMMGTLLWWGHFWRDDGTLLGLFYVQSWVGFARVGQFLDTSGRKIREKQSWSNESVAEQVEGWHWYLCYSPTPRVFAYQIRATWWFSILSSNFRKLVLGPLGIKKPKLRQIHLYIIWMAHEGGGRGSKLCSQPY